MSKLSATRAAKHQRIWYGRTHTRRHDPCAPLSSIEDAIGTWPETATAVAVRLGAGEAIEICAPLGVADLIGGVWRRNPRRVSLEESRAPGASPPGATIAWRDRRQPWLSGRAAPSGRDRVVDMTAATMCNRWLRIVP